MTLNHSYHSFLSPSSPMSKKRFAPRLIRLISLLILVFIRLLSLVTFRPSLDTDRRVTPGHSSASAPFKLRIHPGPSFVVTATSVGQVRAVVVYAARAQLYVSAKSGGRSYAAYGETNLRMRNLTAFIDRPAYSQHSSAEALFYDSPSPEFSFIGNALISLAPLSRRLSSTSTVPIFFRYTAEAIDLKIVNVVLPPNRSANGSAAPTRPSYRRITSRYSDASAPFNLRIHPGPSFVVTLAVPSDASAFVHRDAFLGAFETNLRMPNLTTFIHRPAYSQHSSAEAPLYDSPPPEFSFIGNALISLAPLSRRLSSTFTVPIFFRYTAEAIDLKIVNVVLPPNRSASGSAASTRPPYRRITSSYSDASAPFNLRIHPGPSSVVTL
ncbi:hypothetical protein JB92DRAFT_1766884 [Gautieria morchelliformis]|nr:hypothetical protein JB92DRAFT_1766884 [Gautieria morchelliformis]